MYHWMDMDKNNRVAYLTEPDGELGYGFYKEYGIDTVTETTWNINKTNQISWLISKITGNFFMCYFCITNNF